MSLPQNEQLTNFHDQTCSICLLTLDSTVQTISELACGHVFHLECIHRWDISTAKVHKRRICPNCREKIDYKDESHRSEFTQLQGSDLSKSVMNVPQSQILQGTQNEPRNINRQSHRDTVALIKKICWFSVAIPTFLIQVIMIYYFIVNCGDLITDYASYPFLSVAKEAKGFIAIGIYARGIISIGLVAQGLVTVSLVGTGILLYIGQIGIGIWLGIYQVGLCGYCWLGHVSLAVWESRKTKYGINLFSPLVNSNRKYVVSPREYVRADHMNIVV